MIRSRLGLKALGLCAVVLGLMAFSVSAAQAEVGATWKVNGASIPADNSLKPIIENKEIENKTAFLATKIAGAKVEYLCTEAKLVGAVLETNGGISTTAGFKILFHGCVTLLNGVVSAGCVPKTAGQPVKLIETALLKGLILLHKTAGGTLEDVVDIDPFTGLLFATIEHNVKECALPEKVAISGHVVLKDCKNLFLEEKIEHLLEQHSLTHLFAISDTVEHAANLVGSNLVKLGGAHAGLNWSGKPA